MIEIETCIFGTATLGGLLIALSKRDSADEVCFDFAYFTPNGRIDSYRGFYEHLALGYHNAGAGPSVAMLCDLLASAVGQTFCGYKGGNYKMTKNTPIWVANPGEAPSTAIVSISDCDYMTIIETRRVEV